MGAYSMSYTDLRSFMNTLEREGDLVRITEPVSADQEITAIQHRVLSRGGPALLFEKVIGSDYPIVSNLFGTLKRVEMAMGGDPAALGEKLAALAHRLMPPSVTNIWSARSDIRKILRARLKRVRKGPILDQETTPPRIDRLPVLTCWPHDGGPFFTLPLVHTVDPTTGVGNLGIYRMQRYDDASTGMHWQIEKGGGFHFRKACERGQPLHVSVFLGGPPALTIAAIAPLPEGIDERMLAALMMGCPLEMIHRKPTCHLIPATAEFVLEGKVFDGDTRREGPFGDHLGHYSHSADFPVFRIDRMLSRRDAVYPATVVGKPPQEDFFIGVGLVEMTAPLLRLMRPAIIDLWSYPESGFHPMAVASVRERYPKEALKHAFGILGEGQLSLTKILIITGPDCDDVRDFEKVSGALWRHLDIEEGFHLITPTAQDTLDFTGPAMNTGSRLILLATARPDGPIRTAPPPPAPKPGTVHKDIDAMVPLGEAFLIVRVKSNGDKSGVTAALWQNAQTKQYLFHVLVSMDVDIHDPMMVLWGWFTRFDPLSDIHPIKTQLDGNRVRFSFPVTIDATWKTGYRKPVEIASEIEKLVTQKWSRYGID
jgi:UbiD family decarboxylase